MYEYECLGAVTVRACEKSLGSKLLEVWDLKESRLLWLVSRRCGTEGCFVVLELRREVRSVEYCADE